MTVEFILALLGVIMILCALLALATGFTANPVVKLLFLIIALPFGGFASVEGASISRLERPVLFLSCIALELIVGAGLILMAMG